VSQPGSTGSTTRAGGVPAAGQLDADLQRTVRRTAFMRQGFYVVVLLVALAGQVSGAVEALHIPLIAAIPAVGALELGGIVVLANADVRRRLGERANASRLLSVVIAAGAVAFNWLAHADHLLGGFFAGMSALGYLVWLMHTENQRRDRLRATGDLAWTTPAYEVVGHWLAHPWLTRRARSMAKADPGLGLYDSLAAARAAVRRERRQSAISKVLHRKIRAAVDPTTADIAVHVYDLEEIATRLADSADYAGLTALIAADLAPARLAAAPQNRRNRRSTMDTELTQTNSTPLRAEVVEDPADRRTEHPALGDGHQSAAVDDRERAAADRGSAAIGQALAEATGEFGLVPGDADRPRTGPLADVAGPLTGTRLPAFGAAAELDDPVDPLWGPAGEPVRPTTGQPVGTRRARGGSALPEAIRGQVEDLLPRARNTPLAQARPAGRVPAQRAGSDAEQPAMGSRPESPANPLPAPSEASLRSRVHATLNQQVPPGDSRDNTMLVDLVTDELQLSELERLSAANYVHSWRSDVESGRRVSAG
jgi:hypothetical protein